MQHEAEWNFMQVWVWVLPSDYRMWWFAMCRMRNVHDWSREVE